MATIEERVRAGATLLDSTVPGWAEKINVNRLDVGNCDRCMLGQLYGQNFFVGKKAIGIDSIQETAQFGFYHEDNLPGWESRVDAEYAALRTAWLAEIDSRLQTPEAEEARIESLPAAKEASPS